MTLCWGSHPEVGYVTYSLREKEKQYCGMNNFTEVSKPVWSSSVYCNAMHGACCDWANRVKSSAFHQESNSPANWPVWVPLEMATEIVLSLCEHPLKFGPKSLHTGQCSILFPKASCCCLGCVVPEGNPANPLHEKWLKCTSEDERFMCEWLFSDGTVFSRKAFCVTELGGLLPSLGVWALISTALRCALCHAIWECRDF